MKKILLFLALAVFAPGLFAQSTITGAKVQYPAGTILAAGEFCFNTTCTAVTNGAFSDAVTNGTQTVTVTNSGQTSTYLSVSGVVVSANLDWDTYTVTSSQTVSGMGAPTVACQLGATYTQTDSVPANKTWSCNSVHGQLTWQVNPPPFSGPSGIYSGTATPNFICTAPCTYYQLNSNSTAYTVWSVVGTSGQSSSTWTAGQSAVAGAGAPSYTAGAAAGTSPGTPACASSHVCDNLSGVVDLTMGSATTTGILLTVSNLPTRVNQGNCTGTAYLAASPYTAIPIRMTETTSTYVFNAGSAPTASTAYELAYTCPGK